MNTNKPIDISIYEPTQECCKKCDLLGELKIMSLNLLATSSNIKIITNQIRESRENSKFYERTVLLFAALSMSLAITSLLSKYLYIV